MDTLVLIYNSSSKSFPQIRDFFFVYHHLNMEKTTLSGVWPRFLSAHDVIEDITC